MAEGGTAGVLCRYYINGACRLGSRCKFSHDRTTGTPDSVCRYYLLGQCAYGNNCRYDHVRPSQRGPTGGGGSGRGNRNNISSNKGRNQSSAIIQRPATSSDNRLNCNNNNNTNNQAKSSSGTTSTVSPNLTNPPPYSGKFTVLRKQGQLVDSSIGDDANSEGVGPASPDWVNAPEFVPRGPPKSYAEVTKSEDDIITENLEPMEGGIPLCPYAIVGECQFGDRCPYIHGEVCDLCGKACLNPMDVEQQKQHREECIQEHERDMELSFAIQRSVDKSCGICMDLILEKEPPSERRFGILEKCSHIFCLGCIRKWRNTKHFESKTTRACPECRVPSDFVTPSKFWVDTDEEKEKLIGDYKKALSLKPCKYFQQGRGECPFAGACFYLHAYPDGRKAELPPPQPRRWRNQDGDLETMRRIFLWDFFEVGEDDLVFHVDLEDMLDLLSDTDDDSDWSDLEVLVD